MTSAVIWVQHLLGTGHTVRAAALARALGRRGVSTTLLLGALPPPTLDLSDLDCVQLSPVRATDATFRVVVGQDGTPYEELRPARTAAFVAAVDAVRPDILLTESYPLGRNRFHAEITPVLERLPGKTLVATSVRDVLVRKAERKQAAMVATARRSFHLVLVHADPSFVRLEESFGATGEIADLIRYTGFVRDDEAPVDREAADVEGEGDILVSAGGGGVGAPLVEAALGAARRLEPPRRWRILVPPALADRLPRWRERAPECVVLEPNRPDFRALLRRAALSVSQAGYNTVLDVLEAGTRAILVPFAAEGETEQTDRAAALERRGLARRLDEVALDPARLASEAAAALAAPAPVRPNLDLDGADHAAEILLKSAATRQRSESARP